MTASTLTITDFLLSRIAEEIALAREVQAEGVSEGMSVDDPRSPGLRVARLLLADCKAKRAIVELFAPDMQKYTSIVGMGERAQGFADGYTGALNDALNALAQPYADHPDFDQAWAS